MATREQIAGRIGLNLVDIAVRSRWDSWGDVGRVAMFFPWVVSCAVVEERALSWISWWKAER